MNKILLLILFTILFLTPWSQAAEVRQMDVSELESRQKQFITEHQDLKEKENAIKDDLNSLIATYKNKDNSLLVLQHINDRREYLYVLMKASERNLAEYTEYLEKEISKMTDGKFIPSTIEYDKPQIM